MVKNLARLSVFVVLVLTISSAKADSFFAKIRGNACENVTLNETRSTTRYKAYDKAALQAVKSSSLRNQLSTLDEHTFNVLAYRLADKALNDVTIITTKDDEEKICVEISGVLDNQKTKEIIGNFQDKGFNPQNVAQIAEDINTLLPKSIYETDENLPLLFIKNLEYYNHTETAQFTALIKEKIAFEPRVLITDKQELADYFIKPKLMRSQMEKITDDKLRFSMSAKIEVTKIDETVVLSEVQNRYIIIEQKQNPQEIAHKLLQKLLEDCLQKMSKRINGLQKY